MSSEEHECDWRAVAEWPEGLFWRMEAICQKCKKIIVLLSSKDSTFLEEVNETGKICRIPISIEMDSEKGTFSFSVKH